MILKRLPLKGVHNFRDLGGYPSGFDKATKWKQFFRADGLFELQKDDIDRILSYCDIKTVIDLRSSRELEERPNVFSDTKNVRFENVPLIQEDRDMQELENDWKTLEGGYISIAKYAMPSIRKIFSVIAETLPGTVLYHCTAGKDRTGIISCLILGICGVDNFDIMSDYEISCTNITRDLVKMTDPGKEINMDYIVSPSGVMKKFIDFVEQNYGSITEYVLACGVGRKEIDLIIDNFVVDINS